MESTQIERVEQISSLEVSVQEIRITSQNTYDRAVILLGEVKSIMKDAPLVVKSRQAVADSNKAHDSALTVWHTVWDPLVKMETFLKARILQFDRAKQEEEDRKRRQAEAKRQAEIHAEQARLAREAIAEADKKAAAAAAQAKRDGESKAAQERARRQAEADTLARTQAENAERIAAMEAAPLPTVKDAYQRDASVQTRDNWCWEFSESSGFNSVLCLVQHVAKNPSDLYLLEPERLIESHPALNKVAKAQKTMCKLPGGRAVNKGSVAASAR